MAPMDVMDAGRMLVAADITGAAFGVWQGRNTPAPRSSTCLARSPGAST